VAQFRRLATNLSNLPRIRRRSAGKEPKFDVTLTVLYNTPQIGEVFRKGASAFLGTLLHLDETLEPGEGN
jgi:hypothetical protein